MQKYCQQNYIYIVYTASC